MTTDSANSERERIDAEIDKWMARCAAAVSLLPDHLKIGDLQQATQDCAAELTSLRACVSRKDEEIEGLRKAMRSAVDYIAHLKEGKARLILEHAIAAQAEGRQEWK